MNTFIREIDLVERNGEVILYEEIEDLSFEEEREVDIDGTDCIEIVVDKYLSERGFKLSYIVDSEKFFVSSFKYCDSGREEWEQTPYDSRHNSRYEVDGRKLLAHYVAKGMRRETDRNVANFIADKLGLDISSRRVKHELMVEAVRSILDSSEIYCKSLLQHQPLRFACELFASADNFAEKKRNYEKNVNR